MMRAAHAANRARRPAIDAGTAWVRAVVTLNPVCRPAVLAND